MAGKIKYFGPCWFDQIGIFIQHTTAPSLLSGLPKLTRKEVEEAAASAYRNLFEPRAA